MRSRKGFTLIELVVTLALIGIIAISTLTIFDTGLRNIVRSGARTIAVTEASHGVINSSVLIEDDISVVIELPDLVDTIKTYNIEGSTVKGIGSSPSMNDSDVEVEIIVFKPD